MSTLAQPQTPTAGPNQSCCAHSHSRPSSPTEGEHNHLNYKPRFILAAVCGLVGVVGYLIEGTGYSATVINTIYGLALISGGWFAALEAFENLRKGQVDVHFLMLLVAAGAFSINAEAEGAVLLFLFSLSGALEALAEYRTHKAISSLYKIYPTEVIRREGPNWVRVPLGEVRLNDELLIKPGELFPTDGAIFEGETSVDESALTGEALPVSKLIGDKVFGGTLNQDGQAVIRVTGLPQESAVQKIIRLIENAQRERSPSQRLTEIIGRYYTWGVLAFCAVAFFGFRQIYNNSLHDAFYRTMVLLVVASPCALVISIPSAILAAIASGARRGVLFRGGGAVENLARVTHFALDKTGTVTRGTLQVERVLATRGDESAILRNAAAVEQYSTHPLGLAIVEAAKQRGLKLPAAVDVKNEPGGGMFASINGRTVHVGNRKYLERNGFDLSQQDTNDSAHAEVCIGGNDVEGVILLSDELRAEAKRSISELKALGAEVSLLSGDRERAVAKIASALAISDFASQLQPADKLDRIHSLQHNGHFVAMTGDGVNDAPSLAAADVAIAMGDRASDSALEQADIVLMGGRIQLLPRAVILSRKARSIIKQNVTISLGVVVILVINALLQNIPLTLGVLFHEGSTVVVVMNSLRLLGVTFEVGDR